MEYLITISTIIFLLILLKIYVKLTTGKCTSKARLDGKTVIITGANSGIGKTTALDIASRGAKVILACRNKDKATAAQKEIIQKTGNDQVIIMIVNLESLESIRQFAKEVYQKLDRLDILINNAGTILDSKITEDGLSLIMQTNHFGPFLLTVLLIDLLKKSAPSRIVTVASAAHLTSILNTYNLNKDYWFNWINYSNSKLCNILMSNELARRLNETGVTSNSLHPGVIRTELFQYMPLPLRIMANFITKMFFKTEQEGAQTTIYVAVDERMANVTGEYFSDCKPSYRSSAAKNEGLAKKVWDLSESFVNLKPEEKLI